MVIHERNGFEEDNREKTSVIIPTFNRKSDLRECLNSIYKQDYLIFEVLIFDNGSMDGTGEMIRSEYPNVRLFCNKKNLGVSQARKFGIAKSLGSYIWFLDSGSVVLNMDKIY